MVKEQSNTSQVTESDSSNCNFRNKLIVPIIGLFHESRFLPNKPLVSCCLSLIRWAHTL